MRKIVTKELYTYMDGMFSGPDFTHNAEVNEPLKQNNNKNLEGLCVDGHGNEEGIAQTSRTGSAFCKELGYRLKFTARQKINSHRKQRQAAKLSQTHKSSLF